MSEGKIYMAIADAMVDINAIGKTKKNQQQGFMFRGIDDAYNQLHPIMAKHRIFSVPVVIAEKHEERTTKSGGHLIYRILTVRYTFFADDGSSIDLVVIGEGMDSGDKAASKAMAIAHKYALMQLFCVPTEDMIDPDAETQPESIPVDRMKNGINIIAKMLEKNKDILDPVYAHSITMDVDASKDPEALGLVYKDLAQTIKVARREETKVSTKEGFAETAARIMDGKIVSGKKTEPVHEEEFEDDMPDDDKQKEIF